MLQLIPKRDQSGRSLTMDLLFRVVLVLPDPARRSVSKLLLRWYIVNDVYEEGKIRRDGKQGTMNETSHGHATADRKCL